MNARGPAPNVPHIARLRVEDFLLLHDAGAFEHYAKTELIEGEILCVNAQYSRHARVQSALLVRIANALAAAGSELQALVEVSVRLSDESMPQPDIVLTDHRGDGPVPLESVALLVEISDTTLKIDLVRKAMLYSRAGIPEYWVVDVLERRVLLHMLPGDDGYAQQIDAPFGEQIFAGTIEELALETGGL